MRYSVMFAYSLGAVLLYGCATSQSSAPVSQLKATVKSPCSGLSGDELDEKTFMQSVTSVKPLVEYYKPNQKVKFRRTTGIELYHPAQKGLTRQYLNRKIQCYIAQNAEEASEKTIFEPGVSVQVFGTTYGFHIMVRGTSRDHAQQLIQLAEAHLKSEPSAQLTSAP